MPARLIRQMLREEIEDLLPAGAVDAARVAEDSERKLIKGLVGMLAEGAGS